MIRFNEQRIGIFIDVSNLYHSAKNLYNAKVNFKSLIELLTKKRKLIRAIAYDVEVETKEKEAFLSALSKAGIEIKSKPLQIYPGGFKKGDWDIGITTDCIKQANKLDAIVICTGDGDFAPLVRYLKENGGVIVEIASFRQSASTSLISEADIFYDLSSVTDKILIKYE